VSGTDPEARIKAIVSLAHTGKPEDVAEYERLQPELRGLIAGGEPQSGAKPVWDYQRQAAAYARRALGRRS
jgi:hypothetical protein